jgi:hypothetical protein
MGDGINQKLTPYQSLILYGLYGILAAVVNSLKYTKSAFIRTLIGELYNGATTGFMTGNFLDKVREEQSEMDRKNEEDGHDQEAQDKE